MPYSYHNHSGMPVWIHHLPAAGSIPLRTPSKKGMQRLLACSLLWLGMTLSGAASGLIIIHEPRENQYEAAATVDRRRCLAVDVRM